jgi:hypothetical protein
MVVAVFAYVAAFSVSGPERARASEIETLQSSVISTDMFLNWLPAQKSSLKLSSDQVKELRDIQVDFKLKSQDLGKEIGALATQLAAKVNQYPIPIGEVRPKIRRLSELRGELTYSAITSLSRVQGTLNRQQWETARRIWSTLITEHGTPGVSGSTPSGH